MICDYLHLFPTEDQPLLGRWDSFLLLDSFFDSLNLNNIRYTINAMNSMYQVYLKIGNLINGVV